MGGAAGAAGPVEPAAAGALAELGRRLGRVARGWTLAQDAEGYVVTPPDGDWSRITTRAALEAWLGHQERWRGVEPDGEPVQLEMFDAA